MNRLIRGAVIVGLIVLAAAGLGTPARGASPLTVYAGATLAESEVNDGDSFLVRTADGQTLHLRLYFVDCPETDVYREHDARRVREQARYFGVESPDRMIWLGRQAADFVEQVLARPFTVHTAHAKALGGARSHRIYGFVVTAAGRDLGELLVENGLGRNFGVSRPRYDGLSSEDVELRLRDLEASAMLATRGVWSESNPARIVEFRAEQRRETAELRTLLDTTLRAGDPPVNINTASRADLERLPGIGPVMAHRIYAGRPFVSVDDLARIPGVGGKTLERLRPLVVVAPPGNG